MFDTLCVCGSADQIEKEAAPGGEQKTSYHQVGTMFAHDKGEGFNLQIIDGVSVSGRLVAFPPKPKDDSQ